MRTGPENCLPDDTSALSLLSVITLVDFLLSPRDSNIKNRIFSVENETVGPGFINTHVKPSVIYRKISPKRKENVDITRSSFIVSMDNFFVY